jgi:creatinine amidohydrolase
MALHHTAFPGSISLRPSTLIAMVQDYVKPLARAGFSRFFFINGHGGNIATLKAAFAETYASLVDVAGARWRSGALSGGQLVHGAIGV